jgi:hypothetical protein
VDKYNECANKGGKCQILTGGQTCKTKDDEYTRQYDKWACRTGTCCIKEGNYYSYLDYIQKYRGDGAILYEKDISFKPGEMYAITFISPRPDFNWAYLAKLTGTGGIAAGALFLIPGVKIAVAVAGVAAAAGTAYSYFTTEQRLNDINAIFVSKLDSISNECQVQPGTDGT